LKFKKFNLKNTNMSNMIEISKFNRKGQTVMTKMRTLSTQF